MSLIRPLVRMCVVGALRGATWAEERVYDSDNTPLADAIQQESKPYIVVYTDEDNRVEFSGNDIYRATRNLSLVLEIGVASMVQVGENTQVQIPPTDEGMELAVDVVESQALGALFGNTRNAWRELLNQVILRVVRAPSQRGGSAQAGTRWAARQCMIICDVISDTPPGIPYPVGHPIRQFIDLAKATPFMAQSATLFEMLLTDAKLPEWRQAQAWLGVTKAGIRAIGLAPISETDEEPTRLEDAIFTEAPIELYPASLTLARPTINGATFERIVGP